MNEGTPAMKGSSRLEQTFDLIQERDISINSDLILISHVNSTANLTDVWQHMFHFIWRLIQRNFNVTRRNVLQPVEENGREKRGASLDGSD